MKGVQAATFGGGGGVENPQQWSDPAPHSRLGGGEAALAQPRHQPLRTTTPRVVLRLTHITKVCPVAEGSVVGAGMTKIHHVKIPVTDLQRSVPWYRALLDLELTGEFVEQGVIRGVVLTDHDSGCIIALRDRAVCASRPDLTGFDPFAVTIASTEALHGLLAHCDRLGVEHSDIMDSGTYGLGVDVPDPDGTVLRFLCGSGIGEDGFVGVEWDDDGRASVYDQPRFRPEQDPDPAGGD
jgi:catechol 2,3-dioxygenase-like lactoylglutathione lyase family enzyme